MRSLIRGLLSVFILISLLLLGISLCSKDIIIGTTEIYIKEEITNKIVDITVDSTSLSKEKVEQIVTDVLDKNSNIKEFINDSFDKFLAVINDESEVINIDLVGEVDALIEEAKPILNEHYIVITDEMKDEIMSFVSSDRADDLLNNTINEIKSSVPEEFKSFVKGFSLFVSFKFRVILTALIVVFLLVISLLKKSYYKWTINLGILCVLVGIMFMVLVSLFNKIVDGRNLALDVNSMNIYGFVNLILGILLIIIFVLLNKVLNRKVEEKA